MINKWMLFNFKSIRKKKELEFKPLTIFAGANSSGKSTVLQSILLISQTLNSKVPSKSVILNGPLIKLGQFDDIKSQGSEDDQITIAWEIDTQNFEKRRKNLSSLFLDRNRYLFEYGSLSKVECELSFDIKGIEKRIEIAQLHPELFSSELIGHYQNTSGDKNLVSYLINRSSNEHIEENLLPADLENNIFQYDIRLNQLLQKENKKELPGAIPIGVALSHFFPEIITYKYNSVRELLKNIEFLFTEMSWSSNSFRIQKFATEQIPLAILELIANKLEDQGDFIISLISSQFDLFGKQSFLSLSELIKSLSVIPKQQRAEIRTKLDDDNFWREVFKELMKTHKEFDLIRKRVPNLIRDPILSCQATFTKQLKYLGPLRDEPKSLYPLSASSDPRDIGLKGEYTAAVLNLYQEEIISYIQTNSFREPQIENKPVNRTLLAAVNDWLVYLGVADVVSTKDMGKLGHELKLMMNGLINPIDLTHVGVGVSQVLPILVSCLLASEDTTLIFEQPELHLHPKVQTLLGDFFLSMALLNKQCIIETHSEYLINRLRFRAAADSGTAFSELMKIYFAESKDGVSDFKSIDVNEYGAIVEWPKGFFDQSQREAERILKHGIEKRKKRNDKGTK